MTDSTTFSHWCIVELMGRTRIAGYVTEQTVAGAGFFRVEVPALDGQPAFSRLIAPGAVYGITPTTEELATQIARMLAVQPLSEWDLPADVRQALAAGRRLLTQKLPTQATDEPPDDVDADVYELPKNGICF